MPSTQQGKICNVCNPISLIGKSQIIRAVIRRETDPSELRQMLESANKYIKTVIIGLLVLTKMEQPHSSQVLPITTKSLWL